MPASNEPEQVHAAHHRLAARTPLLPLEVPPDVLSMAVAEFYHTGRGMIRDEPNQGAFMTSNGSVLALNRH